MADEENNAILSNGKSEVKTDETPKKEQEVKTGETLKTEREEVKTDETLKTEQELKTHESPKTEQEEKTHESPKTEQEVKTDELPETEQEERTADAVDVSESEDVIPRKEKSQVKKAKRETNLKQDTRDDSDDENEDEDEEELPPGLLELPLEVEGKREKKKVERLSASMIRSPQEKKKLEIEEGSGMKLGDIPHVEHQLNITKAADLKPLHRVLFLRAGTNNEIKKNIRQFSGFTHSKDSKEHEKRVASLNKMVIAELKTICLVLGLERSGTKVNLVDRIMNFLIQPEDLTGKNKAKKKSKSASGKPQSAKKQKSKQSGKKGKTDKDDISADDTDEDEKEDGEELEEEEEDAEQDESEDEIAKKKKTKKHSKKGTTKKSAKENEKKNKETRKPSKRPVVENDSLSEDSEGEPAAKIKKSPPSNEEIKKLIEKLLKDADLETVTMKTVMKQVYDNYPLFDLSDRKDFIKETVRKVIT